MAVKDLMIFFIIFFVSVVETRGSSPKNHCLNCHVGHYFSYKSCRSCHRGIVKSSRKEIAHYGLIPGRYAYFRFEKSEILRQGNKLIQRAGCLRCHKILDRGNLLATPLDLLPDDIEITKLVDFIKNPPMYMPEFEFRGDQIVKIINVILRAIFYSTKRHKREYYYVHFESFEKKDIFSRKCGMCHKILTKIKGGLGKGNIGPNLSGLFTQFYPQKSVKINETNLGDWLKNPRSVKELTLMPPVDISPNEVNYLIKLIKN